MNESAVSAEALGTDFGDFGEHPFFCLLYEDPARRQQVVAAFLRAGIDAGEKIFGVCNPGQQPALRSALIEQGLPVEGLEDTGRLAFLEAVPICAADWLVEVRSTALNRGFSAVRVFFEMSADLPDAITGRLGEYLVALDRSTLEGKASLLLAFNRKELPGPMLLEALRLFPAIVHEQQVFRNSYYRSPHGISAKPSSPGVISRFLDRLRRRVKPRKGQKLPWPYRRGQVLEALFNAAPIGLWLLDHKHRMVFTNRNFCEATGVSAEQLLSARHYSEVLRPEEVINCMLSDARAFNAEGPVACEEEFTAADGSRHTYQVVKTRVLDDENRANGLLGLAIDITERKNAERLQHHCEARFRDIALSMADFIWEVDQDGVFRYCSDKVLEMLGYSAEEVVGRKYSDFISGETAERLAVSFCPEGESGGSSRHLEHWAVDKSGRRRCLRISGVPMFDDNGTVLGYRGVTEDITRQRELDRLKAEFMSMVAHELRTPLTSILGYLEFCLNPEDFGGFTAAQQREFLGEINSKAELLAKLVSDLLDIGRIESGRPLPLDIRPVSMAEVIGKVVETFQFQAPRHRFLVQLERGPADQILADRDKLVQVLENLLGNAVKYSPEGGQIGIVGDLRDTCYRVEVQDEGIGMTAEQASRAFDKFYRADFSNTAGRGLGLGMSIAREIVERHGGSIWLESEVGRGTRVTFTLPRGLEEAADN